MRCCVVGATQTWGMTSHITRHHAPEGVFEAAGYSNCVVGEGRIIAVAGQVARDADGNLVGKGDFRAQAEQVFENLRLCLAAAGATFLDVIKLNYYLADMADIVTLREIRIAAIEDEHLSRQHRGPGGRALPARVPARRGRGTGCGSGRPRGRPMKIAVCGLGRMGTAMAERLVGVATTS